MTAEELVNLKEIYWYLRASGENKMAETLATIITRYEALGVRC